MSRRKSANKGNGKHRQNRQARVRPQPSSRATYADLLTIGALFVAIILVVTLGFQWALP